MTLYKKTAVKVGVLYKDAWIETIYQGYTKLGPELNPADTFLKKASFYTRRQSIYIYL